GVGGARGAGGSPGIPGFVFFGGAPPTATPLASRTVPAIFPVAGWPSIGATQRTNTAAQMNEIRTRGWNIWTSSFKSPRRRETKQLIRASYDRCPDLSTMLRSGEYIASVEGRGKESLRPDAWRFATMRDNPCGCP